VDGQSADLAWTSVRVETMDAAIDEGAHLFGDADGLSPQDLVWVERAESVVAQQGRRRLEDLRLRNIPVAHLAQSWKLRNRAHLPMQLWGSVSDASAGGKVSRTSGDRCLYIDEHMHDNESTARTIRDHKLGQLGAADLEVALGPEDVDVVAEDGLIVMQGVVADAHGRLCARWA
jgi:hypothetical protein